MAGKDSSGQGGGQGAGQSGQGGQSQQSRPDLSHQIQKGANPPKGADRLKK